MMARGVRFITDVETNGDGSARAFFVGPGDQLYSLQGIDER